MAKITPKHSEGGTAVAGQAPTIANVLRNDPPPGAKPPRAFRVSLMAPTPLAENDVEIEAASPDEAWREFCKLNGISDSVHPKKIEPLY